MGTGGLSGAARVIQRLTFQGCVSLTSAPSEPQLGPGEGWWNSAKNLTSQRSGG